MEDKDESKLEAEKIINGFIDFFDGISDSTSLQKYKTTKQYTAVEMNELQKEAYLKGRRDEGKAYKQIIKQKYLEACYEQNEGKDVYDNRIRIECYEKLLEDK